MGSCEKQPGTIKLLVTIQWPAEQRQKVCIRTGECGNREKPEVVLLSMI